MCIITRTVQVHDEYQFSELAELEIKNIKNTITFSLSF
jgi:hypothetical protein